MISQKNYGTMTGQGFQGEQQKTPEEDIEKKEGWKQKVFEAMRGIT